MRLPPTSLHIIAMFAHRLQKPCKKEPKQLSRFTFFSTMLASGQFALTMENRMGNRNSAYTTGTQQCAPLGRTLLPFCRQYPERHFFPVSLAVPATQLSLVASEAMEADALTDAMLIVYFLLADLRPVHANACLLRSSLLAFATSCGPAKPCCVGCSDAVSNLSCLSSICHLESPCHLLLPGSCHHHSAKYYQKRWHHDVESSQTGFHAVASSCLLTNPCRVPRTHRFASHFSNRCHTRHRDASVQFS